MIATLWLADQRCSTSKPARTSWRARPPACWPQSGVAGLRDWLSRESVRAAPDRLYVLDSHGNDLLGRRVPEFLRARIGRGPPGGGPPPELPPDTRDVRWLSQLVSPNGDETYALSLLRARRGPFGMFRSTEAPVITAVATLLVSAVVCFLLARYLSDPIRHLRAATRSIAAGDLSVRVAEPHGPPARRAGDAGTRLRSHGRTAACAAGVAPRAAARCLA